MGSHLPDLVIRHGRKRYERALERAEPAERGPDPFARVFAGHGRRHPAPHEGEIPGVRDTRRELIEQEVGGGMDRAEATSMIDGITRSYEASVRAGLEPRPERRH